MSIRLSLLEIRLPGWIRRRMFRELVRLTADAFGAPAPDISRLSAEDAIAAYARFTRGEVERTLAAGTGAAAVRSRLHRNARDMGAKIRRLLGVTTPGESIRALRLLYAAIGIDLDGDAGSGEIAIRRCAFSGAYTPAVCAFVSALDGGVVDGITGGRTLVFAERITEGSPCCRARLVAGAFP